MTATALPTIDAITAIARLAIKRAVRGRGLWIALALALLPTLYAIGQRIAGHDPTAHWDQAVLMCLLTLPVVPPILVASAMSDEIDEKTSAYLWSRPLARWTIVVGKFVGLTPFVVLAVAMTATISWLVLGPNAVPAELYLRGVGALAAGAIAASAVSAMIATLVPRFSVATAVCWLLIIDAPIGALDAGLHVISSAFGVRALTGLSHSSPATGALSLLVLTGGSLAVAIWRMNRIE